MNYQQLFRIFPALLLLILLLPTTSCKQEPDTHTKEKIVDPLGHITDPLVKDLLTRAMLASGTLETWNSLTQIQFRKQFSLFGENGNVETESDQIYLQRNQMDIASLKIKDNSGEHIRYQLGPHAIQIQGNISPGISEQAKRNTALSSSFVISIPFNLLDPGAQLSHAGFDTLDNGSKVEVLKAIYDPQGNQNHSTPDTWWHFFDANSNKHLAYMVQHADHFSYVENLEFEKAGGILFPKSRDSWRVNKHREKLWLRAKYQYSRYEVY